LIQKSSLGVYSPRALLNPRLSTFVLRFLAGDVFVLVTIALVITSYKLEREC